MDITKPETIAKAAKALAEENAKSRSDPSRQYEAARAEWIRVGLAYGAKLNGRDRVPHGICELAEAGQGICGGCNGCKAYLVRQRKTGQENEHKWRESQVKHDAVGHVIQTEYCSHPAGHWPGCSFCKEQQGKEDRSR